MRRPLIAGNWKMYKTIGEAVDFVRAFKPLVVASTHCDILIAPPFTAIRAAADAAEGSNVMIAGQNVGPEPGPSALTGEVSASMLVDAGATFAILGHSERRQHFGESDGLINRKLFATLGAGLLPIVCVGETLEERDAGNARQVVERQVLRGLENLTSEQANFMIIAYEPVWAIGTGRTATPEQAEEMHAFIRSLIRRIFEDSVANGLRILYGGSVKPDNAGRLMEEADIDGALVGGASLAPDSFAKIVNYRNGG
ncbi:MAG: triose-phosphate isomerase [Blastocatellia bacterium]